MLTYIDGLCRIYRKEIEICSQLVQQKVIQYAFIILYWNQGPSFITIPKVILHIEICGVVRKPANPLPEIERGLSPFNTKIVDSLKSTQFRFRFYLQKFMGK